MSHLVKVNLSKKQLDLVAGAPPDFQIEREQDKPTFEVTVVNASQRFASFRVAIALDGVPTQVSQSPDATTRWYRVEPQLCTKKPPGASTHFKVVIEKAPIPAYGKTLSIQVRVFSVEFEDLHTTESLELTIHPPKRPLKIYLPFEDLKVYPGDRLTIPVIVSNLGPEAASVQLTLMGEAHSMQSNPVEELPLPKKVAYIRPEWFSEGREKVITVGPGSSREVEFCCHPPNASTADGMLPQSQPYFFTLRAVSGAHEVNSSGQVEILPYGTVQCVCSQRHQVMNRTQRGWSDRIGMAQFPFEVTNKSNLAQQVTLQLWEEATRTSQPPELVDLTGISYLPLEGIQPLLLTVKKKRPWMGWERQYTFTAIPLLHKADSGEPSTPIQSVPEQQTLDLTVRPILPVWLQLLGTGMGLLLLALLWWLNPRSYHVAPVNSVRLIGNETTVVSGSSDQTLRRWDVAVAPWRTRLWHRELIAETGKAIRVIRESPFRDGQIAVGLESGDIELWEVSPPQRIQQIFRGSDRTFDLDFTANARYLFSGHGSGLVRQWDLQKPGEPPVQQLATDVAIAAVAVMDLGERSWVAIAGQYNTLLLWDWQRQRAYHLNYTPQTRLAQPVTQDLTQIPTVQGKGDYINSLAIARNSTLLAIADNRGTLSLWDVNQLATCIDNAPLQSAQTDPFGNQFQSLTCDNAQLTQWQGSPTAIHAVALSEEGCYLTTASDNGQIRLWPLTSNGIPLDRFRNGIPIAQHTNTSTPSVDIERTQSHHLLIATSGPHHRVTLYHHRLPPDPTQTCPTQTPNTLTSQPLSP